MAAKFDRWTLLKLIEVILVIACLVFKRVTDDESARLFLYLQKLSREWSLLNNVTWDRIGSAVADAIYGGYIIITTALFFGRLFGELPTRKRITEFILLGVGAILFVTIGSIEFASLDQVPPDLVDNAAILGTLSVVTGALLLLDMGGPKAKKPPSETEMKKRSVPKASEIRSISQQVYDIEKEIERREKKKMELNTDLERKTDISSMADEKRNGVTPSKDKDKSTPGEKKESMKDVDDGLPKKYGIYGRDFEDTDVDEPDDVPPKMESHSPVWSKIRKGEYGKYDVISPRYLYPRKTVEEVDDQERPPSGPGDPGYVQYTAQHWGEPGQKTPRHSPTEV